MAGQKNAAGDNNGEVTDGLAREVTLRAKIDGTGLTVGGKSRALAAADQLLGAVIGIPSGWLEGIRRRSEIRRNACEQFLRTDVAAALSQLEGISDLGKATLQRLLRDEYRKQENRASVWIAAEEQLVLAAPEQSSSDATQRPDGAAELNSDWLNRFTDFAENVSTEELQRVWGRVLAGEIRKPGSFSISSLRVLAELEPDLAQSFETIFRRSIGGYAVRPEPFEGRALEESAALEHAGLIQADSFLQLQIRKQSDGFGLVLGSDYLLRVTYEPNHTVVQLPVIRITRVGQQLGSILERDELAAFREMSAALKNVSKLEICRITGRFGDTITWNVVEIPKS